MATQFGNLLQIIVSGTYLSQQWSNVFYYRVKDNSANKSLSQFLGYFTLGYNDAILPIMHAGVQVRSTEARNLTNGIDIAVGAPVDIFGAVGGEGFPAFVAYAFRYNRETLITRHGQKRIVGVSELRVNAGVANADFLQYLNAAADWMNGDIGDTGYWIEPVILGRYPLGHPDAGKLDLTKVNGVSSVVYTRLTTQNTRKPGRGV